MSEQTTTCRLRIRFAKGRGLRYISHLDLARAWERILRRAGLPMDYSRGFNPRPHFQIASGLPLGIIGRAELLDVWLTEPLVPAEVMARLAPVLPADLEVQEVREVEAGAPSLQSQVRAATYRAVIESPEPLNGVRARVEALLAAPTLPRRRHHKGSEQAYDLRPLIQCIDVEAGEGGSQVLILQLQASPEGAGRPDQVLEALGLAIHPHIIERVKLHFEFDK